MTTTNQTNTGAYVGSALGVAALGAVAYSLYKPNQWNSLSMQSKGITWTVASAAAIAYFSMSINHINRLPKESDYKKKMQGYKWFSVALVAAACATASYGILNVVNANSSNSAFNNTMAGFNNRANVFRGLGNNQA